jgi:xanthosine utilization system XapX-like protein
MLARMARAKKNADKKDSSAAPDRQGRVAQMRAVWSMTYKADRRLPLRVFGPAVAALAVLVVVGILIHHPIYFSVLGVVGGLLVATTLFGRRATSSMYAQVEGQPGAAASVLQTLRGEWRITPAVAFNRNMDLVHRVIGRPGVVLVGEGNSPAQQRQLIVDQKRRVGRVAPETPIYEVLVGDGEGQVPLRKLQQHVMKLPRNIGRKEVGGVEARMKALGGTNVPLPKGPMPRPGQIPRGKMR